MTNILLLSCILIICNIFFPMIIGVLSSKGLTIDYFFSSRDQVVKTSIYYDRSKKAFVNLLETYPIFLTLMFLSIINDIDNFNLCLSWVVLRFVYIPIYILGFKYIRTFVWLCCFVILVFMGLKLV